MKSLLFLVMSLLTLQAQAWEISTDLKTDMKVDVALEWKHEHSTKCYWKKKGNEWEHKGSNLPVSGGNGVYQVNAGTPIVIPSINYHHFTMHIRDTILHSSKEELPQGTRFTLTLVDNWGVSSSRAVNTGGCKYSDGFITSRDAAVSGQIKLRYRVPDNVWLVRVRTSDFNGVFDNQSLKKISNSLSEDKGYSPERYLWVKPGTEIEQNIEIPRQIRGAGTIGAMSFTFEPVGIMTTDPAEALSRLESLYNLRKNSLNNLPDKHLDAILENLATLARSKSTLATAIISLETSKIGELSNFFFELANHPLGGRPMAGHIKVMAAIASYELSLALLTELAPYCKSYEIELPFTHEKREILGLRAAGFWLGRAVIRLEAYDYSPYRELINELVRLEKAGLTYSQVATDKDEMTRLRKALNVIGKSQVHGKSPFGAALFDLQKTLFTFKSIGAGEESTQYLFDNLKALSQEEESFYLNFMNETLKYNSKETGRITSSQLFSQLSTIEEEQKKIVNKLRKSVRLLSASTEEGNGNVVDQMTQMILNQISLFDRTVPVDQQLFEAVKSNYLELNNADELINSSKVCVGIGE